MGFRRLGRRPCRPRRRRRGVPLGRLREGLRGSAGGRGGRGRSLDLIPGNLDDHPVVRRGESSMEIEFHLNFLVEFQ